MAKLPAELPDNSHLEFRYEIRATDAAGKTTAVGWGDDPDAFVDADLFRSGTATRSVVDRIGKQGEYGG